MFCSVSPSDAETVVNQTDLNGSRFPLGVFFSCFSRFLRPEQQTQLLPRIEHATVELRRCYNRLCCGGKFLLLCRRDRPMHVLSWLRERRNLSDSMWPTFDSDPKDIFIRVYMNIYIHIHSYISTRCRSQTRSRPETSHRRKARSNRLWSRSTATACHRVRRLHLRAVWDNDGAPITGGVMQTPPRTREVGPARSR